MGHSYLAGPDPGLNYLEAVPSMHSGDNGDTISIASGSDALGASSQGDGLDILLVDDEPDIELVAGDALRDAGHRVTVANNGADALHLISTRVFDIMICDIRLPKVDGLTLFRRTRQESPDTTVILMTAFAAVQDAVAAVKEGAHDYLTKPFEIDEITLRVARIAEHRALLRELERARAELAKDGANETIVGRSVQILRLLDRVNTIATSHAPVLLQGESGTGKELVARALHERGPRRGKPFVAVNCAAFPDTLLEAELFGHERGRVHGRGQEARRALSRRTRRHAAAGRSGRDVDARAGQAAARAAGGGHRTAGNQRVRTRRRARHLRDPPQPEEPDRGRAVSRGPVLPPQRAQHRHPAAARAPRRPAAAGAVLPQEAGQQAGKGDAAGVPGGLVGAGGVSVPGQRAPARTRHPARRGAGRAAATSTSSTCPGRSRAPARTCAPERPSRARWGRP